MYICIYIDLIIEGLIEEIPETEEKCFFPSGEGDITQDEDQLKERLTQIEKGKIQMFWWCMKRLYAFSSANSKRWYRTSLNKTNTLFLEML